MALQAVSELESRLLAAGDRIVLGAEAELDNRAGVGDQFSLPAVVFLKLLHGRFGLGVPVA